MQQLWQNRVQHVQFTLVGVHDVLNQALVQEGEQLGWVHGVRVNVGVNMCIKVSNTHVPHSCGTPLQTYKC